MVADLLKGFVKEEWASQCDFATLEKVCGSYLSDDLRDREDDLILRILGCLALLYQDLIRTENLGV